MPQGDFDFPVDAQLPPALAKAMTAAGFPTRHLQDVGLLGADDASIWAFAQRQGCALITKDEDFVSYRQRTTDGVTVVWLRIRNSTTPELLAWFLPMLPAVIDLIESGEPLIELR